MSKTGDNNESFVFKASSVQVADQIRCRLIHAFEGCWFYVYNTGEIWVTNEFGGKIKPELLEKLVMHSSDTSLDLKETKKGRSSQTASLAVSP